MIDPARLSALHTRIVAGDVTATSELFALVQRPLAAVVRKRISQLAWDDACDAATDAIVSYINAPDRFDPTRAGLFGYLALIARRDSLNLLRDYRAAQKKQTRVVELSAADGKDYCDDAATKLDAERILRDHLDEIVKEDGDEEVLRLFLAGEGETAAYAAVLGISDHPEAEQKKVVKQRRDRIEQRLKRLKENL